MFNTAINLLSPQKKNSLKKVVQFLFIKEMLELTIFTCVLLSITHLLAGLVMTKTLNDLANTSLLINREFPSINGDIRRVNALIKNVNDSSSSYTNLSPKLLELIRTIPNDIQVDGVSLNRKDLTLSLSGVAQTRDALLHFQTVLSSLPWITQVSTPVSQLFQKDNISFQIQTTIKDVLRAKSAPAANTKGRPTNE